MYGYNHHASSLDLKEYPERFQTMWVLFPTKRSGRFGYNYFLQSPLQPAIEARSITTLEKSPNATITYHFGFLKGKLGQRNHRTMATSSVSKSSKPHENETPEFSNASSVESVFEKLETPFKAKKNGVFLFAISFFLPKILKFLLICKLGTNDVTRCVCKGQQQKIKHISAKNEVMQWKLCMDI